MAQLERQAQLPEVVAIGEIGLDYARSPVSPRIQKEALKRILSACRAWDKPVVIHCREAYQDLRDIVAEMFPAPPAARHWGVIHCFSGTIEDAVFFSP